MVLLSQMLYRLRMQVLWYGVGLAFWAGLEMLLFPSVASSLGDLDYPEEILNAFGTGGISMSDPRAFFTAEFFSLGPLVLGAFAIFASTGALAGEEGSGTMEMLASLPVARSSMFFQKLGAILVAMLGVIVITSVGWTLTMPFADLGRELTNLMLVGATLAQLPFTAFIIATGLFFGAVAPSRSTAAACTGAIMVVAYLVVAIASAVESVSDIKYASPYYYSDLQGVLIDGIKIEHQLVLGSVTAIIGLLALGAFEAREFGGERWQFSAALPRFGGAEMSHGTAPIAAAGGISRRRSGGTVRVVVLIVLLAVVAAGGYATYSYVSTRPAVVSLTGRVDASRATVLAPASGLVSVLAVAEGQHVKQGDVLAWIENSVDGGLVPVITASAGRITTLELREGQFALVGMQAVVIQELDLHVLLEVDEDDIGRVAVGQPVELSFASLALEFTVPVGSVASNPTANPALRTGQARKYEVKVPLAGADPRIIVGLPADARIHVAARP
ncbi:MAG: ABC transporter permease subunit [Dehalococcoidia bacterium]